VANAQQLDGFGGDVDRLFVSKAQADNGPSMKRVRPAPMGRAFRIVKRTTHLTIEVTERPQVIKAVGADGEQPKRARKAPASAKSARKQADRASKADATKE
jgi:large subunit ribosomal protein L22